MEIFLIAMLSGIIVMMGHYIMSLIDENWRLKDELKKRDNIIDLFSERD